MCVLDALLEFQWLSATKRPLIQSSDFFSCGWACHCCLQAHLQLWFLAHFLNMQKYTRDKRTWLTEVWNVRFCQVPALFTHPRAHARRENVCLTSERWKELRCCRRAACASLSVMQVTSFPEMWFSNYATLSIQVLRNKALVLRCLKMGHYLVFIWNYWALDIKIIIRLFPLPCCGRFDNESFEDRK